MNHALSLHDAIRILVVDDSAFMRTTLSRMIACESGIEVIGTAGSGSEALEKIPTLERPLAAALETILPLLPRNLPVPILIVQHTPVGFTVSFARRLSQLCSISVQEANDHELLRCGVAYIAPAGLHMRVRRQSSDAQIMISFDSDPHAALHIPSVDVLMQSVAEIYHDHALGVIMTGWVRMARKE